MQTSDPTLEEIEGQTRRGIDAAAAYIDDLRADVSPPFDDIKLFLDHLEGKRRMLDVGCGWAYYADQFVKRDAEYLGIDLSPKMVEIARADNPALRFEVMSFRSLAFADGSFDGLWCCCALNHVPKQNLQTVLAEMRRVLVPSGALLIVMPHSDEGWGGEYMSKFHEQLELEGHYSAWEYQEFLFELIEAQFEVLKSFIRWDSGSMTFLTRK